ncbi:hypothetical protein KIL84_010753, partial [Mauremys mutica]
MQDNTFPIRVTISAKTRNFTEKPRQGQKDGAMEKHLSAYPILRSVKEHNTVYEMMKLIPDIRAQLSDEELRELSMCTIKEYWAKGSTVVGNQGFYAILKGSARPQARCYKRMLGEDFDSSCVAMSTTSQATMFGFSGRTMLIRGSCFGTLETAPPKLPHILLSIITEENCEILKISSTDYLRIKEVKQTRQVLVGQLHEKQSFGEVSILLQTPFTCRVVTATDVKLGIIDASAILGLDVVIQMLLLQTAEPTFNNITQ